MKHAIIYKRERISRPIVQGFYGRALLRSKRGDLILAPSAPLRVASADAVIAGHLVALDGAAKMQHSARLGGEFDVVPVNEARDGAGLVGPFEMAAQDVAVLLDLDELLSSAPLSTLFVMIVPLPATLSGGRSGGASCAACTVELERVDATPMAMPLVKITSTANEMTSGLVCSVSMSSDENSRH